MIKVLLWIDTHNLQDFVKITQGHKINKPIYVYLDNHPGDLQQIQIDYDVYINILENNKIFQI